ncbi:MAG: hypothetical protein L0177_19855 [Chloroflexi bacterium]|nr:hypothetical protein [Chloroflexota bacterium]
MSNGAERTPIVSYRARKRIASLVQRRKPFRLRFVTDVFYVDRGGYVWKLPNTPVGHVNRLLVEHEAKTKGKR